jgi:putative phosphoribosyl transferase
MAVALSCYRNLMRTSSQAVSLPLVNRRSAGRLLAQRLEMYSHRTDVLVLGLPRGGLPVAQQIAEHLHAPLDVLLVRKLGVPGQRELAFGAIAAGGVRVLDREIIRAAQLTPQEIEQITAQELRLLESGNLRYRDHRPAPEIRGRIVILADDGIATGSTMKAAVEALRSQNPSKIVVASPVVSLEADAMLRESADEVVALAQPEPFYAVGFWYEEFSQITDDEVDALLNPPELSQHQ